MSQTKMIATDMDD